MCHFGMSCVWLRSCRSAPLLIGLKNVCSAERVFSDLTVTVFCFIAAGKGSVHETWLENHKLGEPFGFRVYGLGYRGWILMILLACT